MPGRPGMQGTGKGMLTITRRPGEQIRIGDDITITVMANPGYATVRIGVEAPRNVEILREELTRGHRR